MPFRGERVWVTVHRSFIINEYNQRVQVGFVSTLKIGVRPEFIGDYVIENAGPKIFRDHAGAICGAFSAASERIWNTNSHNAHRKPC